MARKAANMTPALIAALQSGHSVETVEETEEQKKARLAAEEAAAAAELEEQKKLQAAKATEAAAAAAAAAALAAGGTAETEEQKKARLAAEAAAATAAAAANATADQLTTYLRGELSTANAAVVTATTALATANATVATLTAERDALLAGTKALRTAVEHSCNLKGVALNATLVGIDKLDPLALAALHSELTSKMEAKYKPGAVAQPGVSANDLERTGNQSVDNSSVLAQQAAMATTLRNNRK